MTDLSKLSDDELLALIEKKKAEAAPEPSGDWGMVDEAVDMLSLGGAKKLNAAGAGLIDATIDAVQGKGFNYSDNYNRHLAAQQADQEAYGEQHPVRKRVGQAAGVAAGVAAMPIAAPFRGTGMLANTGNAVVTGTGYGAAGGAIEDADSSAERANNMLGSAAWGAAFGTVAPWAAKGLGKSWSAVRNYFANRGVDARAITSLLEEMRTQGLTPRQAMARLRALGPDAMLADTSPAMQIATGATAAANTAAGGRISERLAQRREGGHGRVEADLNATIGPARDPYTVEQAGKAVQRTTGSAYERAREYVVDTEPALQYLDEQLRGPFAPEFDKLRPLLLDQSGNQINRGDLVHGTRERLDDMISSARQSGANKLAGRLNTIRDKLKDALHQGVPGFREADATYASEAKKIAAFEEGRTEVLKSGSSTMTPAELAAKIAASSADENAMRVQGVRSEIDRVMSNQRMDPSKVVDRTTTRDWNDEKIAQMIGQQRADQLRRGLDREETFGETSALGEATRNSRTAPIQEASRRMWGMGGEGSSLMGDIAAGTVAGSMTAGPKGAVAGAVVGAANNVRQRIARAMAGRASAETINRAADMLTETGQARDAVLTALDQEFARLPQRKMGEKTVERLVRAAILRGTAQIDQSMPWPGH